jgi:hypothetical protein
MDGDDKTTNSVVWLGRRGSVTSAVPFEEKAVESVIEDAFD